MKFVNATFLVIVTVLALSIAAFGQTNKPAETVKYDAELAKRLGGNDNGMKSYVLVILRTGPKDAEFKGKARDDIFAGHMANIGRLADQGKLLLAGPFGKNDLTFRGVFVFDVTTVEEARKLAETDPAVKAGVFVLDIIPWFATAAVTAIPEIHKKIIKPSN